MAADTFPEPQAGITLGVIGECMLELHAADGATADAHADAQPSATQPAAQYELAFGGDVLNTAVYAARLGAEVSFFTATGDDYFSEWLVAAWQREGVGTSTVRVLPGATPSLYIVRNDASGERSFHYWREASPFKRWLSPGAYADELGARLSALRCVYFSGITLALLGAPERERLLELLTRYRAGGGLLAFDPNHRPRLWGEAEARTWMDRAYAISDFALPSYDDEARLYSALAPEEMVARIHKLGAREVALKLGAKGALLFAGGAREQVDAPPPRAVVDTTAAGDAFNAGYLCERLREAAPREAAATGHRIAGQVVAARGAIVPTCC